LGRVTVVTARVTKKRKTYSTMLAPSSVATCVLSPHPFFIEEMARWLEGMAVSAVRLGYSLSPSVQAPELSEASVCVVDACFPPSTTEGLIGEVLTASPRTRLLAVVEELTDAVAFPLLRLGVKGIVTYAEARRQLVPAVEALARGGAWIPRDTLSAFLDGVLTRSSARPTPSGTALSPRERDVLEAVLESQSNKEIATRLNISERTVKFHVSNLLAKYSVRRRADLILQSFSPSPAP
jgi:DNA-binding NarL/FixJ family response regulator